MRTIFGYLTLNRIGAAAFVIGVLLLVAWVIFTLLWLVVKLYYAAFPDSSVEIGEPRVGLVLISGLACLLYSKVVFALASTLERLARIEAKLDAMAKERVPEEPAEEGRGF